MSDSELAHEGDVNAQARLCRQAFGAGDHAEALKWAMLAAAQGHCVGQGALGVMYRDGYPGVIVNHTEAVRHFTLAAQQGSAAAMCNLSAMYQQGLGCEQSTPLAVHWGEKAAELGHAGGQANLAALLLTPGEYYDPTRGRILAEAAAAAGDEAAVRLVESLRQAERFVAVKAMAALGALADTPTPVDGCTHGHEQLGANNPV